jgi:iron complex transport system ATP-binding protein
VPTLELQSVGLVRDERAILADVNWSVDAGERWIVLGPNGSGKTSLIRIASLYLHPTTGTVTVLGEELGRTDVRKLRRRVGVASAGFSDLLRPSITATDIVMTAKHAALEPWWHEYGDDDRSRAVALLERSGVGSLAERPFGTLSSGERQRVLLARTLMTEPGLLLLDVAGREQLVDVLDALARDRATPPTVLVTHHVEEIPPNFTHALLLRDGRVLASGPIDHVLDRSTLSACFGVDLDVERDGSRRWSARLRRA